MTSITFDGVRLSVGRNVNVNDIEDGTQTNPIEEENIFTSTKPDNVVVPEHSGFHLFDKTEYDPKIGDAMRCKGAFSKAGDAICGVFQGIGNFFGNIFNGIGNFFTGLFGAKEKDTDALHDEKTEDIDDTNDTNDNAVNNNQTDDSWRYFQGGNLPDKSELDFNVPDDVREELIEKFNLEFYDEEGYVSVFYDTDGELVLLTPISLNADVKNYRQYGEIRYQSHCANTLSDVVGIAVNVEPDLSTMEEDLATRDGEIGDTKQGWVGDCWLLSGVNSLSYTEEGRQIIKDALEYHDGYTTVHLKGAKDYDIADEEVEKVRGDFSTGDDDMLILELAIQKAFQDVSTKDIILDDYEIDDSVSGFEGIITEGSYPVNLLYLLTGKDAEATYESYAKYGGKTWEELSDEKLNDFMASGGKDVAAVLSAHEEQIIKDINGNDVKINGPHAYALKEVTDDTITFTNPHDSSIDITISRDLASDVFKGYSSCDLSDNNPEHPANIPSKVYDDGSKVYVKETGNSKDMRIDAYTKDGERLDDIVLYCFNGEPSMITRWNWNAKADQNEKSYENYSIPESNTLSRQEIADKIAKSGLIGRYDLTLEEIVEKCLS